MRTFTCRSTFHYAGDPVNAASSNNTFTAAHWLSRKQPLRQIEHCKPGKYPVSNTIVYKDTNRLHTKSKSKTV